MGCLCRTHSLLLLQLLHHRFCPGTGIRAWQEHTGRATNKTHGHHTCRNPSGGGREGGRQESPLLPENTCQPKAGASMRCKNDRNVMLWLHNTKTVKNTAVNPRPAPSCLCTSCHEVFPTWGWRVKCKSHLWHPLNNSFTLSDPQLCWPHIQGVPRSQTHPSDFQNAENTCRDVHVLTLFAVWPVY